MSFKGKRVIVFCIQTMNLNQAIVEELENLGAVVDFYDERPNNSILAKGLIRLNHNFLKSRINKHYETILKDIDKKNYDILLAIRGEIIPSWFLSKFTKQNPKCKKILYTWDSIKNNPHPLRIKNYFNKSYTFDHKDAEKYSMCFYPLFFFSEYLTLEKELNKKDIDVLYIGTLHSDRGTIANKIQNICNQNNRFFYGYHYIHSPFVLLFKIFFEKRFSFKNFKKAKFQTLTKKEVLQLYSRTNIILDINHPDQNGLTLRSIEALGSKKKLITTNQNIRYYKFYDENNIHIIDRKKVNMDKNFFNKKYKPIDSMYLQNLILPNWLENILIKDTKEFEWLLPNKV